MLKYKNCALADELRKQNSLDVVKIGFLAGCAFVVVMIVLFCTFKWYQKTKKSPYCCRSKKRRNHEEAGHCNGSLAVENNSDFHDGFDETWATDMNRGQQMLNEDNRQNRKKGGCMSFCLSEPVQDCFEFFDCDFMWRKKNVYTTPYFGKSKKAVTSNGHSNGGGPPPGMGVNGYPPSAPGAGYGEEHLDTLQRRPTRPAPPPPQLPAVPGSAQHTVPMYDDGTPIGGDEIVCEPIPEAPPSPEPVRAKPAPDQQRSMYSNPKDFMHRPFLRFSISIPGFDSSKRDSRAEGSNDEPDALYSRVKDFLMSKVRKTTSTASINRTGTGVSCNPDGGNEDQANGKSKYGKTGSLASLHNIAEAELDKDYSGSKRSMSLASLHMLDNTLHTDVRSRSTSKANNIGEDDVPPNQRDEYVDLEEMARKIAARSHNQEDVIEAQPIVNPVQQSHIVKTQPLSAQSLEQNVDQLNGSSNSPMRYSSSQTSPVEGRTPDFIPASAYVSHAAVLNSPSSVTTATPAKAFEIGPSSQYPPSEKVHNVATVAGSVRDLATQQQISTSAFNHPNYTSFQDAQRAASVLSVNHSNGSISPPAQSPIEAATTKCVVPYTRPNVSSSSTPNGTLKKNKPIVPPRPSLISENPAYKSLTRTSAVGPPSPKIIENRKQQPVAAVGPMLGGGSVVGNSESASSTIPHSPRLGHGSKQPPAMMVPPPHHHMPAAAAAAAMSYMEQQQLLQHMAMQQTPHHLPPPHMYMSPTPAMTAAAMQHLLLQQQQQEHNTIMTPAVQEQMLREQQAYQMLQHQQQLQQYQQQLLQHQLLQHHQFQQGMRYRQPLSSTSSTGSTASSQSSRSVTKPKHPPPPPPTQQQSNSNSAACNGANNVAPIESSI